MEMRMRIDFAMVVRSALLLLFATAAFAQDYPKLEMHLTYSYMRFNPEDSHIVSSFSLNGGGGGAVPYINHAIGIQAEFQGYGSLTKTFTFPAIADSPCPIGCSVTASANLFTYNVGPIFKYRTQHFEPFVEALFGG